MSLEDRWGPEEWWSPWLLVQWSPGGRHVPIGPSFFSLFSQGGWEYLSHRIPAAPELLCAHEGEAMEGF